MNFKGAYEKFSPMWNTPFRFHHTKENHLDKILPLCDTIEFKYFALFHDIYYNPYTLMKGENEEISERIFNKNCEDFEDLNNPNIVREMIRATIDHDIQNDNRIQKAIDIDLSIFNMPYKNLIEYENLIFKEYQKIDIDTYKKGRTEILYKFRHRNPYAIDTLIEYVTNKKYKIGIYPGSFNPFHIGHLNILKQAEKIFDKVILVQAINPDKNKQIINDLPKNLPNQMVYHKGLITELFNKTSDDYTMIRGLRDGTDLIVERNYREWVKEFKDIPFIYFLCDIENIKVSSSVLRNLENSGISIDKWIEIK